MRGGEVKTEAEGSERNPAKSCPAERFQSGRTLWLRLATKYPAFREGEKRGAGLKAPVFEAMPVVWLTCPEALQEVPSGPRRKLASLGPIHGLATAVTDGWSRGFHRVPPDHAQAMLEQGREEEPLRKTLSREGNEQRRQEHPPSRAKALKCSPRALLPGVRRPRDLENGEAQGPNPGLLHLIPTGWVQSLCFYRT